MISLRSVLTPTGADICRHEVDFVKVFKILIHISLDFFRSFVVRFDLQFNYTTTLLKLQGKFNSSVTLMHKKAKVLHIIL